MNQVNNMKDLISDLCSYRTGVVSDENQMLFDRIAQEIPLELFSFRSGDSCNGWVIPSNWIVKKAVLYKGNEQIFDFSINTLGVGYYSKSFSGELDWEELLPHLVTNPELPDAFMFHCMWQYRPWDADWRLVLPYTVFRTLKPGRYRVELETEYKSGEMIVAHCHKKGKSEKTIVFNSNNCHPHMANDGFAGTAVLIHLMQWLMNRETYYSYRLVIGPEHLGSVFYLRDLPRAEVDAMVSGVFEEMPGTSGPIVATSTFTGGHMIDEAFINVLRHYSQAHRMADWRKGAGNDETVWEAPGYEIPFVELTRCENQFAPYAEYHSSLDTPDLMQPGQLQEMLECLKKVVDVLENNSIVLRRFDGLICLSNPEYELYMERPDPTVVKDLDADAEKWGHLLDCLFRYMDGDMTILDMANRHDLPFDRLYRYLCRFQEKGLVELKHAEIQRKLPRRVGT